MKRTIWLAVLGILGLGLIVYAQSQFPSGAPPQFEGSVPVRPTGGAWVSYSPTQLGANAITLPASGNTALTNIIDTRGAKEATLHWQCSQIANLIAQTYTEDGSTQLNSGALVNSGNTGANFVNIGSESTPSAVAGGGSSVGSSYRLPQRALAFQWGNTTATAGTCTARLFVQY